MNNLKKLRVAENLTLDQLSEYTDINRATISRLENNQTELNATYIKKLTEYFNVSSDYLLGLSKFKQKYSEDILIPYTFQIKMSKDYKSFSYDIIDYKKTNIQNSKGYIWYCENQFFVMNDDLIPNYASLVSRDILVNINIKLESVRSDKYVLVAIKNHTKRIDTTLCKIKRFELPNKNGEYIENNIILIDYDSKDVYKLDIKDHSFSWFFIGLVEKIVLY